MMLNPYLFFNGNCEEAFKFYEKTLGGKIEAITKDGEGKSEKPKKKRKKFLGIF